MGIYQYSSSSKKAYSSIFDLKGGILSYLKYEIILTNGSPSQSRNTQSSCFFSSCFPENIHPRVEDGNFVKVDQVVAIR